MRVKRSVDDTPLAHGDERTNEPLILSADEHRAVKVGGEWSVASGGSTVAGGGVPLTGTPFRRLEFAGVVRHRFALLSASYLRADHLRPGRRLQPAANSRLSPVRGERPHHEARRVRRNRRVRRRSSGARRRADARPTKPEPHLAEVCRPLGIAESGARDGRTACRVDASWADPGRPSKRPVRVVSRAMPVCGRGCVESTPLPESGPWASGEAPDEGRLA